MPTQIVVAIDDASNRDAWGLRPKSPVAWSAGNYAKGTVVTYSGQLWLAQAQTSGTPGVSADWESILPSMTGAAGAMFGQGAWNAATNSPTLASGVGTEGYFYRVSTAGTTTLDGMTAWNVGDFVAFISGAWRKIRGHVFEAVDIDDSTSVGRALLTAANALAQRVSLQVDQVTLVNDANQTVTSAMSVIAITALTADRTMTLAAASAMNPGQVQFFYDESGACSPTTRIILARAGSDTINGAPTSFVIDKPYGGAVLIRGTAGKYVVMPLAEYLEWVTAPPPVRQTVNAGPVTTAGLPDFLPGTSGSLSLTSQNLSSTVPFLATAANGATAARGQSNRSGIALSNLTWSALTASSTLYLYVTVNADGTLTPGFTTLAPIYQLGGTPATTSGQFTFNYGEMKGYMGGGSTAPQAYIVFVGECITNGSTVTSAIAYAYNGLYSSGWTATLPTATSVSKNANLGVAESNSLLIIECTTTNNGYAVGDRLSFTSTNAYGANGEGIAVFSSLNIVGFGVGNNWPVNPKGGGLSVALTVGSWKYKLTSRRVF